MLGSLLWHGVPPGALRGCFGKPLVKAETEMRVNCLPGSLAGRKVSFRGFTKNSNAPRPHSCLQLKPVHFMSEWKYCLSAVPR